MALLLPTMFGTAGCGINPRVDSAPLDRAKLEECPRAVHSPGVLPDRHPFTLDDGRVVVPIGEVNARENMLTQGALVFKGAWVQCRSVVIYVEDRDERLAK